MQGSAHVFSRLVSVARTRDQPRNSDSSNVTGLSKQVYNNDGEIVLKWIVPAEFG